MVDVLDKPVTHRTAVATGSIQVGAEIMERLTEGTVAKGDVLGVARVAGIMSVKHTSDPGANVSPPSRHQMHRGF